MRVKRDIMKKPSFEQKALNREDSAGLRDALRIEIRDELGALERYEAQHGSFPDLVLAHYERHDGAV
jgi:hypothetical protein